MTRHALSGRPGFLRRAAVCVALALTVQTAALSLMMDRRPAPDTVSIADDVRAATMAPSETAWHIALRLPKSGLLAESDHRADVVAVVAPRAAAAAVVTALKDGYAYGVFEDRGPRTVVLASDFPIMTSRTVLLSGVPVVAAAIALPDGTHGEVYAAAAPEDAGLKASEDYVVALERWFGGEGDAAARFVIADVSPEAVPRLARAAGAVVIAPGAAVGARTESLVLPDEVSVIGIVSAQWRDAP